MGIEDSKFECDYCKFTSDSELGLNVHRSNVHLTDFEDRFWDRVETKGEDECWPWTGHIKSTGYGKIKFQGQDVNAQRAYYIGVVGVELSDNVHALHKCDNKKCLNPSHLYLGTHQDNMKDVADRDRIPKEKLRNRNGEDNPNSKLSNSQVIEIYERLQNKNKNPKEIASDFPVPKSTIDNIKYGATHEKIIKEHKENGGL